ncbi:MAG: tetratricopeptide repeat protein [candidate division Zixibacteria bacterium]|nr:tetratricopeptide repeat protein [candidate division Zixibacteria bacterium]
MHKAHSTTPRRPDDTPALGYLWAFAAVVLLQITGGALSTRFTWGFGYWGFFVPPYNVLFPALALVLLFPPVLNRLADGSNGMMRPVPDFERKIPTALLIAGSSLLLCLLFYLFRSRAHFYGDGYSVLQALSADDFSVSGQFRLQPLAALLQHYAIVSLRKVVPLSPEQLFALVNCLGGVIGFWGLVRLSRSAVSDTAARWFMVITACAGGATVLFFGYIENYTWPTACGLWTTAFLMEYAKGERGPWPAVACGLAAALFHVVAAPCLAAVAAIILLRSLSVGKEASSRGIWMLISVAVVGSVAIGLIVQLTGIKYLLVPLWPVEGNPYWVLSRDHLLDLVNHMLLVAPLGIALLVASLPGARLRPRTAVEDTLAVTTLFAFLAAFWIDPLIGMPRDWDLVSPYGFPLALWGGYRFTRMAVDGRLKTIWPAAGAIVLLVCLTPNITEKNHPAKGLARLDRLVFDDIHYQSIYDHAHRAVSWGTLLTDTQKRPDLAEKYFQRRLGAESGSAETWYNLGNLYLQRMVFDSAAACYYSAVSVNPSLAMAWCQLARAEVGLGRLDNALIHAEHAVSLDPRSAIIQASLGVVLTIQKKFDRAMIALRTAVTLQPSSYPANMSLGVAFLQQQQFDSACHYLRIAFDLNGGKMQDFDPLIQATLGAGRFDEAARLVARFEQISPGAPSIERYQRAIAEKKPPR